MNFEKKETTCHSRNLGIALNILISAVLSDNFFCNFFKNCLKSKLNGNLGESQSTKIATDILNRESKMFECVKDEFHSSIHHQVLMYFENCKTDFL